MHSRALQRKNSFQKIQIFFKISAAFSQKYRNARKFSHARSCDNNSQKLRLTIIFISFVEMYEERCYIPHYETFCQDGVYILVNTLTDSDGL